MQGEKGWISITCLLEAQQPLRLGHTKQLNLEATQLCKDIQ